MIDNPKIRRAMSLSLDRKAFIDILYQAQGDIGGAMQPPPAGLWGLPAIMESSVTVPTRGCRSRYRRAMSCITGIPPFS
jgi:peptide/nickel transport system substrate-binding protein